MVLKVRKWEPMFLKVLDSRLITSRMTFLTGCLYPHQDTMSQSFRLNELFRLYFLRFTKQFGIDSYLSAISALPTVIVHLIAAE